MQLIPINQDGVQGTVGVLLTYLEDPGQSTPNNMLDGIVSAKSLCRALLAGELIICEAKAPAEDSAIIPKKKKTTKKTPRKKPGK